MLHTLKGLAGTAGLLDLQSLAADAERLLRLGETGDPIDRALQQIEPVMASLRLVLQGWPPQGTGAGSISHGELLERLRTLRTLLSTDDLDAADFYAALRESMAIHFPGQCLALGKAMDDFAFNDALQLLEPLLTQAGAPS